MTKNIAVVMGGYSSERDISLRSGELVLEHCQSEEYRLWKVDIHPDYWQVVEGDIRVEIDRADFTFEWKGSKCHFDGIFNAIHGHPGENGILTAYFDLIGLPHQCSETNEMMLAFDKRACNALLHKLGFNVPKSKTYIKNHLPDHDEIERELGFPCFVKPSKSGSSFGVSRVDKKSELTKAFDYAFTEDDQVLIEKAIIGTEVGVGVFNFGKETIALPVTEIVSNNAFFDYEAKYEGKSEEITPARIEADIYSEIQRLGIQIFDVLGLKGFSRIDFIVENGTPILIEVNTIPGLSPESIIPQQIRSAGISLNDFFTQCIDHIF